MGAPLTSRLAVARLCALGVRIALGAAPVSLAACVREYHPEYHPETSYSYVQNIVTVVAREAPREPPPVYARLPPRFIEVTPPAPRLAPAARSAPRMEPPKAPPSPVVYTAPTYLADDRAR